MNNKTLIAIIVILILIGAAVVVLGKLGNKPAQPSSVTSQPSTPASSPQGRHAGRTQRDRAMLRAPTPTTQALRADASACF